MTMSPTKPHHRHVSWWSFVTNRFDASRRKTRRRRHSRRLFLEPLEDRTLLSASIFGSIWQELNLDTVRELRDRGIDAVYGDATRPETPAAAGVE